MTEPAEGESGLFTDGGVSLFDGKPFVSVRTTETSWQWTVDEAREFALMLIQTADAAQFDADLVRVMREAEMPDEIIGGLLAAVRSQRD